MKNLSEKIFNGGKYLLRTAIVWIGEIIGFYLIANMSIGLTVDNIATAAMVIIILEIINAIFWPPIARIFLPFLVYTIGIGSLLLNAAIIWIMSYFIPTVSITGYAVILAPLGIAAIHTILTTFLTLGNEDEYYNFIIRRKKRRKLDGTVVITEEEDKKDADDKHGLIVIEIDGLAKDILEEAIEKGYMPTLERWKKETHKIKNGKQIYLVKLDLVKLEFYMGITKISLNLDGLKKKIIIKSWFLQDF